MALILQAYCSILSPHINYNSYLYMYIASSTELLEGLKHDYLRLKITGMFCKLESLDCSGRLLQEDGQSDQFSWAAEQSYRLDAQILLLVDCLQLLLEIEKC